MAVNKKPYDFILVDLNEKNCNGRIKYLSKKLEDIGKNIDVLITTGQSTEYDEDLYDYACDLMNELCDYRTNHDCLVEGDKGYLVM